MRVLLIPVLEAFSRLIIFVAHFSSAGFVELRNSGLTLIGPDSRTNEIFVVDVCDVKLLEDVL